MLYYLQQLDCPDDLSDSNCDSVLVTSKIYTSDFEDFDASAIGQYASEPIISVSYLLLDKATSQCIELPTQSFAGIYHPFDSWGPIKSLFQFGNKRAAKHEGSLIKLKIAKISKALNCKYA